MSYLAVLIVRFGIGRGRSPEATAQGRGGVVQSAGSTSLECRETPDAPRVPLALQYGE